MDVEFKDIGNTFVEDNRRSFVRQKEKESATRISPSNIEAIYPLLDHLLSYDYEKHPPLISVPIKDKQQDFNDVRDSFEGTNLHVAQMLTLTFCRHTDIVHEEQLRAHFPTYPPNGLQNMAYLANKVTIQKSRAERIHLIYQLYHNTQRELLKEGLHLSKKEVIAAWDSKKAEAKINKYISALYYLYNSNHLRVSDPETIMQFEVSLIPRFSDLLLQCPMSIDMIVKSPHEPARLSDLKKGQFPDIHSEESLHQRYLMNAAAQDYVMTLQGREPTYFGSPVIQSHLTAMPSVAPLDFSYTSDRFLQTEGHFDYVNATLLPERQWQVYDGLSLRAQLINDNKPLVRRYLAIQKHVSPVENMTSIFKTPSHDHEELESLV